MFAFLLRLLRPSQEGTLCLHPIERTPGAFVNSTSPVSGALLFFCINQGISASFSLLYFLIIDSGPPGSSPLKDLNTKDFDCVDHNKLWKILKEMGIPDHFTCLLRNLYTGQEATIRTRQGTTRTGVHNWERSKTRLYIVTLLI